MFVNSCLLCVGPFHPAIAFALPLVDEAYELTAEGQTVVTSLFHVDPEDEELEEIMESIAQAVGVEMWEPHTYKIDPKKINWDMLGEILEHDVMALKELIKYGFVVIYVPPTITAGAEEESAEEKANA